MKRSFLVETPFKWYTKFKLHRTNQAEVVKVLILVKNDEFMVKRCILDNGGHTPITLYSRFPGVEEKLPICINAYDYFGLLDCRNPIASELRITNYMFQYDRRTFGLDVYHNALRGLAILTQEYQQDFALPPFLDIQQEITDNPAYSNVALTRVKFTNEDNNQSSPQSE
jgi:hypothetical protein